MSLSRAAVLFLSAAGALLLACGDPTSSDLSVLDPPTDLAARELASGDIEVSWRDNSDGEQSFELVRSSGGPAGSFTALASVAADVSTYEDSEVDGLSNYCYRVRAVGPVGTTPSAFTAPICHQSGPPAAPSQLAAAGTFGQVDLSWLDASDNEAAFEIWSSTDGAGGTFTSETSVAADVTGYSSTGLADGTEHCFRVRAVGAKGQASAFSNTACATTPVPVVPPPGAPTNLAAGATSPTAIDLSWKDNASDEQGFELWRSTAGPAGAFALLDTVGPSSTSASDAGLSDATEYCYQVRAIGGAGVPPSAFSNTSCATTPEAPPAPPTNLAASASSPTAVSLVWADNSTNETGFEIRRSTTGPSGAYTVLTTTAANATGADDAGLAPQTQYCYRVRALGPAGVGSSLLSPSACATTPQPPPPAAPTGLDAAAASSKRINLSWRDNAGDESGYEVWRSNGGATGTYTRRATLPADSEEYSDGGLSSSTQYCYKVLATGANGADDSPFAGPDCATTRAPTVVRVVTFGDSNTDTCTGTSGAKFSYVSIKPALAPTDPHQPCQVAGKIEAKWEAQRNETIHAVNHAIAGTTTGGSGATGDPSRSAQSSPNARTVVNGVTRFEAEVLGAGKPWSGGETLTQYFPNGAVTRVNAYVPDANDFVYVSMGTNDDAGPTRTLSAAQTAANLRWMVQQWTGAGLPADHFILTTLAPRDDANSATSIPDRNDLIRTLASDLGVHLIDLAGFTSTDGNGATWKTSLQIGDGIHYTDAVRDWLAGKVVDWMASATPVDN